MRLTAMMREQAVLVVFSSIYALTANVCRSSDSPTAPSPPPSDFAAQFDSLWSTFDREHSYFDYKRIDCR
jgi:hypothetical protein